MNTVKNTWNNKEEMKACRGYDITKMVKQKTWTVVDWIKEETEEIGEDCLKWGKQNWLQ